MNKLLAALTFFTRLPFWRIATAPAESYKRVVDLWPATGWLTGGVASLTLLLAGSGLSLPASVAAALAARLLVTGALHEDGLADFLDGMGGGVGRDRILAIMKDSHIGTYGVIGLIMYYLLAVTLVSSMDLKDACLVILAADPWSKFCASQIINLLPYARREEEAKNKTVYSRMSPSAWLANLCFGAAPLFLLPHSYLPAALSSVLVAGGMIWLMKRKIGGYTGDCCGATFLLCELAFYMTAASL